MGLIREQKVRRNISIPVSVDRNMRNFIGDKRFWEKGAISDLVVDAINSYINPSTHTQKTYLKKHSDNKYDVLISQIISDYVKPNYGYPEFNKIHRRHIDQGISEILDIKDYRSIRSWKKQLVSRGYIEQLDRSGVEFKILKEGNNVNPVQDQTIRVT